jgi:hypothetical protein
MDVLASDMSCMPGPIPIKALVLLADVTKSHGLGQYKRA